MTALHLVQPVAKTCTKCGGEGPFGKNKTKADGLMVRCNSCRSEDRKVRQEKHNEYLREYTKTNARGHRNIQIKYRYKLDFEAQWEAQKGLCALCGGLMLPIGNAAKSAVVDHNHKCCPGNKSCGECFRGLIHGSCNKLLGAAQDSIEVLDAAITYLKKGG